MKLLKLNILFLFILFGNNIIKGQLYIGGGSAVYVSQSYINNWLNKSHRYIYSEALNFHGKIGFLKDKHNASIEVGVVEIPLKISFKSLNYTFPKLVFPRRVYSLNLNYNYFLGERSSIFLGIGILKSDEWILRDNLISLNQNAISQISFANNRISPLLIMGFQRNISLTKRLFLSPSIQLNRGLRNLSASFQILELDVEKQETPILLFDTLFLDKGNAFIF